MNDPPVSDNNAETIPLDKFLKLARVAQSGGEAKLLIQSGAIAVNGVVETRRGRKLRPGDSVVANGEEFVIESDGQSGSESKPL